MLFLLFVFALLLAGRWLLADMALINARAQLDSWSSNGAVSSLEDWQQAYDSLQRAITLKPNEADYHRQLALLYEWKGFSVQAGSLPSEDFFEIRRQAVSAYRTAALLRPAEPISWSNLARMKALVIELDEEFDSALFSAMALGENIPRVNQELTYIASLSWFYLSDPDRGDNGALFAAMKQAIVRGLSGTGNGTTSLGYLRNAGVLEQICVELDLSSAVQTVQQACSEFSEVKQEADFD